MKRAQNANFAAISEPRVNGWRRRQGAKGAEPLRAKLPLTPTRLF